MTKTELQKLITSIRKSGHRRSDDVLRHLQIMYFDEELSKEDFLKAIDILGFYAKDESQLGLNEDTTEELYQEMVKTSKGDEEDAIADLETMFIRHDIAKVELFAFYRVAKINIPEDYLDKSPDELRDYMKKQGKDRLALKDLLK